MKIAIMQPYFFPYIGYWQLIHASDIFVLFDDVQYIRKGWISRNRILKPGEGWQYIHFPVNKHSKQDLIRSIYIHQNKDWKSLILKQLEHYKKRAPYFIETHNLVDDILTGINENNLNVTKLNFHIINIICKRIGLKRKITISSEQCFDYSRVNDAGEWALRISEQMKADTYINPISGKNLFNKNKFKQSNIKLSFLIPDTITYNQYRNFEPSLSILDMMMFSGIEGVKENIKKYSLVSE